jgi:hypothetical protein
MKTNLPGLIVVCLLLFLSGCCSCNRADWPDSPALGHMNVSQKMLYMENVQDTLAAFRTAFKDIESHVPEPSAESPSSCEDRQFPCEVWKFVEIYAMPIISDQGALSDPQTRLDVARINLLSAYALYESRHYGQARKLVGLFEKQYGEDSAVLSALVESGEMEFATLGEGLKALKRKLALARMEHTSYKS